MLTSVDYFYYRSDTVMVGGRREVCMCVYVWRGREGIMESSPPSLLGTALVELFVPRQTLIRVKMQQRKSLRITPLN